MKRTMVKHVANNIRITTASVNGRGELPAGKSTRTIHVSGRFLDAAYLETIGKGSK